MVEDQLVGRGVRDERVLAAFRAVPRERFVPEHRLEAAYADRPLSIAEGQTISQPYVVAVTVAAMAVRPTSRVLDVGTGSGYAAAILAQLANEVVTIERHADLADRARALFDDLGLGNVSVITGDGSLGVPDAAPFDAIGVAAAAPHVPQSLVDQLLDGGRLVLPVEQDGRQWLRCIRRDGDTTHERDLVAVHYVPLIGEDAHPE